MSSIQDRIKAKIAAQGRNMHEAKGGETLKPGTAFARIVGVVELGDQLDTFEGREKVSPQIEVYCELSGANWPEIDGKLPIRTITFTNRDTPKSNLTKTMARLDPGKKYSHIAELIGKVFYVEVYHAINKKKETRAYIRNLELAVSKDPVAGEVDRSGGASPQIAKTMFFLWDMAELDDWDTLYIGGKYDDGGTRNVVQNRIRAAENFKGSPIYELLTEDGADPLEDIDPVTGDAVPGSVEANKKSIANIRARARRQAIDESANESASEGASRRRRP